MSHFTELEFIKLLEDGKSSFSTKKIEHFNTCPFCKEEYNKQRQMDDNLMNMNPMAVPNSFSQKVLDRLYQLDLALKPKEKTDWLFILAISVLFFVAYWYSYMGNIDILASDYLNGIKEYTPQIKTPGFFVFFKAQLSKLIDYGSKFTYLMVGIISIIIYWILDRNLSKSIHIKKS